jgi:hypothetical protein
VIRIIWNLSIRVHIGWLQTNEKFYLLTRDGFTFTKDNESIENLQVLGILDGVDAEDALLKFKKDYGKPLQNDFEDVIIHELKDNQPAYFFLAD